MMLKVWLYAYYLGVHSTRRLEQRIGEDLAFRYLAGGLRPDHKTLSEFLRRQGRAINDLFTQTIEMGRGAGLVRLGHVAIDSTRAQANASRHRMVDAEQAARQQRARDRRRVRQFQQRALAAEPDEGAGVSLAAAEAEGLEQQLATAGEGMAKLPKGKRRQASATDGDSRFLRTRESWVLGYTGEVAVSDDHFIVAARSRGDQHRVADGGDRPQPRSPAAPIANPDHAQTVIVTCKPGEWSYRWVEPQLRHRHRRNGTSQFAASARRLRSAKTSRAQLA